MENDRREHKRIDKEIAFSLSEDGTEDRLIVSSQNISLTGVMCYARKSVDLFKKVKLFLMIKEGGEESKQVECDGVVVRSEPLDDKPNIYEVAIAFQDLKKSSRKVLMRYIEQLERDK